MDLFSDSPILGNSTGKGISFNASSISRSIFLYFETLCGSSEGVCNADFIAHLNYSWSEFCTIIQAMVFFILSGKSI